MPKNYTSFLRQTNMRRRKNNGMTSVDPLNDVLQRIQEGLHTQDLNQIEVQLLEDRFGHDWFHELGYDNLKPNKDPKFNIAR